MHAHGSTYSPLTPFATAMRLSAWGNARELIDIGA
jgi:hypothetical protein